MDCTAVVIVQLINETSDGFPRKREIFWKMQVLFPAHIYSQKLLQPNSYANKVLCGLLKGGIAITWTDT